MPVLHQTLQQIPLLETARLLLREYRPSDFPQYMAMWADRNFYRYLSPRPMEEEEVWATMLRSIGHWALLGYGFWAVEEKATGHFIGAVGFADPKRDLKPASHGTPEIGWVLAAHVHGQGYATEAVEVALAWGDAHFGGARTICIIHPDNRASLRLAQKFGYRKYHRTIYKEGPIVLLERVTKAPL